ncbi:MAG: histidine phosphatase family protein [Sedimenticolaceae bacterium]|nr:histidine phosphatase family protein [Sedimenticolaceae bacterium]
MIGYMRRVFGILCIPLLFVVFAVQARASEQTAESMLWQALQHGDHFAIMRHALAPGIGDPENFAVDDCSTQRNLSETGRMQAQRIGDRFRANGIEQADVFTSQWCRCRDTAELLGLGAVTELPVLNSFFRKFELEETQTAELARWLDAQEIDKPLVLVTHQVNITAMTGVFPDSGELVIVRRDGDGRFSVAGTIETE